MREVKFRAWNKALNTMADSENIGGALGSLLVATNYQGIEDFIFMQYTGLKDKNGKEIFDADVVKVPNGFEGMLRQWGKPEDEIQEYIKGKPRFEYYIISNQGYAFFLGTKEDPKYAGILNHNVSTKAEDIEVIGNIYENPELLEGATNGSS